MSGDVDRFVERFSALLVDGGMPRMPARVFSRVLAEDSGQLTARPRSPSGSTSARRRSPAPCTT